MRSDVKRRINTLQVLVAGSTEIAADPVVLQAVLDEYEAVLHGRKLRANRYYLLQVLHSTRALDSALRQFVAHRGLLQGQSLGGYLRSMRNATPVPLAAVRVQHFQRKIVKERNRYMHQAGTFPADDREVMGLLAEMHTCLSEVFAL